MKGIYIEQHRCLACRNCEKVCSFQETGGFKRAHADIRVTIDFDTRTIAAETCMQCEKAACMEICSSGAIQRNPITKAVSVDETICLGCKMCVDVCPIGHIRLNDLRCVAAKCNLCDGDPACVKACMARALHYEDMNRLTDTKV